MYGENITLDNTKLNTEYRVKEIRGGGLIKARLRELGLTVGTVIVPRYRGGGGEIASYGIRGAHIALRKETAKLISVCRIGILTPGCGCTEGGVSGK